MFDACCLLLSNVVVAAFCWSLDTLLLVTFGYFWFLWLLLVTGTGIRIQKVLLFVWGMNDHRYHV